jgi:uncharacterized membrane protein YjdF
MRSAVVARQLLFACECGSTLVGYSSLALLVAIAAIALLEWPTAIGSDAPRPAESAPPS